MFEQSRIRLNKWFLNRELLKRKIIRSSINLEAARKIGLLVNAQDPAQLKAALTLAGRLKKQKKVVEVLAYTGKVKSSETPSGYEVFCTKDLDWAFRPKAEQVTTFMGRPFDLLFYFSQRAEPVLDYIMALSPARFRVGPYVSSTEVCDLMVVPEKADAEAFGNLMLFYLEKLNPGKRHSQSKQEASNKALAS